MTVLGLVATIEMYHTHRMCDFRTLQNVYPGNQVLKLPFKRSAAQDDDPPDAPETEIARKGVVYGSLIFAGVVAVVFVVGAVVTFLTRSWVVALFAAACLIAFPFIIRLPFWDDLALWFRGAGGKARGGRGVLRKTPEELEREAREQATREQQPTDPLTQQENRRLRSWPQRLKGLRPRSRRRRSG